ncbi:hypothetical protein ACIRG5_21655 [Lentzea sp. NPDC102401]|uniref:hypothetical protein n=1 Tax=Lentzea sp. NPDC102401 TaxID=3364128 RepID=UPI0037F811D5
MELADDQLYLGILLIGHGHRNSLQILAASLPSLCAIGGSDTAMRSLTDPQRWWPRGGPGK